MDHSAGTDLALHHLPGAALHLRGAEVVAANERSAALFGSADPLDALPDQDRQALLACAEVVERSGVAPDGPLLARIGTTPPVRFVDLHLAAHPTGGVLVLAHDVTERERLDAVIAEFATGVYLTDEHLRATWIPRRVSESVGLPAERFVDSDVYELVHPDDVAATRDLVRRARQVPGVRCSRPLRVRQLDQPDVWWPIVTHLIWRGDDPAIGGLLVRFDIDLAAGVHVRGAEETAQSLVTLGPSSSTGALHLDLEGTLLQRSTRVREILRPLTEDADLRWFELLRDEDRAGVAERLDAARGGTLMSAVEVAFEHGDVAVWARLDVLPYRDTFGNVAGMFVNVLDLTAERAAFEALSEAREQLWHLANHDAMTGLANRHRLADRLAAALDRASGPGLPGPGVIVADLDRFKEINDRYGHRVGDQVLIEVARRLRAAAGPDDLVCRFGGDEFVVLRPLVERAEDLDGLVAELARQVAAPISVDGLQLELGISLGSSTAEPGDAADPDALILRADRAMYAAKAAGRGGDEPA